MAKLSGSSVLSVKLTPAGKARLIVSGLNSTLIVKPTIIVTVNLFSALSVTSSPLTCSEYKYLLSGTVTKNSTSVLASKSLASRLTSTKLIPSGNVTLTLIFLYVTVIVKPGIIVAVNLSSAFGITSTSFTFNVSIS